MSAKARSSVTLWLGCLFAAAVLLANSSSNAKAAHHKKSRTRHARRSTPSPTPSPKPTPAFKSVVLIAGGTGTVNVPTGESPAVLDTAQIYEPAVGKFILINPMTAHRDNHGAAILPDGKVLIVGGVDTVLVPLVSFPGPTMPWILSSTEILD